jgi:hypothetical protein
LRREKVPEVPELNYSGFTDFCSLSPKHAHLPGADASKYKGLWEFWRFLMAEAEEMSSGFGLAFTAVYT